MGKAFFSEKSDREALMEWCREHVGGWFRLERLTDYFHGSSLWQCVRPGTDTCIRFVVGIAGAASIANSKASRAA